MKKFSQKLIARIEQLKNDHEGVAAVEFAMILPLVLVLFVGTFELGQALTVDRRVTQAASSAADLVAQGSTITEADLTAVMGLADSILKPYDANLLNVEIVSVEADDEGETTVGWSFSKGGGEPYAAGSAYSMTGELANLISPTTSVIIAKATYTYTPIIGKFLKGGVELEETFYLRPRRSAVVAME